MRTAVLFACLMAVATASHISKRSPYDFFNKDHPLFKQYSNDFKFSPKYTASTVYPTRPVPVVTQPPVYKVTYTPTPKPVSVPVVPVAKIATDARSAETVRYGNEIESDGAYNYFYETNNGIAAQAQGVPRNFGGNPPVVPSVAQGSFSWTSPEGEVITITYVADENGYQPQGNAIPQPPEVPPQIARALEYIAKYTPVVRPSSASRQ